MDQIKWGMIGCGNVTEKKSGPAFNKVPNSSLVAVMARNIDKASDYNSSHSRVYIKLSYSNGEIIVCPDYMLLEY